MRNGLMISVVAAAVGLSASIGATTQSVAASVSAAPRIGLHQAPETSVVRIGHRRYRCDDDDDDCYPPPYFEPAPRYYGYVPPSPRAYSGDPYWEAPPPPPPPPSSCGKYRYWNGEYCADARRQPPYVGPRW